MPFNLSKYMQSLSPVDKSSLVRDELRNVSDTFNDKNVDPTNLQSSEELADKAKNKPEQDVLEQAKNLPLINKLQELLLDPQYKDVQGVIEKQPEIHALVSSGAIGPLRKKIDELGLGSTVALMEKDPDLRVKPEELKPYFDRVRTQEMAKRRRDAVGKTRQLNYQVASKQAQSLTSETEKGAFIDKYLPLLMSWTGKKDNGDKISFAAKNELQSAIGKGFSTETSDMIMDIQGFNPKDPAQKKEAAKILGMIYDTYISQTEPIIMSEKKPKGIIKFNLSDNIINNQTKTAASHFGEAYFTYGPTEKRICPKLRGKNMGDFVSEYICRHHCLDGIVIDDNKTVCGEAMWRANVMDKFSREYVNAEGEIEGGYLNKRFEINRNVPEENKMRLKPGEIRKPRPASMGNIESRMQDMRNKEAEKRGYRPDSDTSKPFAWDKDVDQNNVEVPQKERDKREEDSGHKIVQYTNRNEGENNPKKAFNLKQYKQAQYNIQEEEERDFIPEDFSGREEAESYLREAKDGYDSHEYDSDNLGLIPDFENEGLDNHVPREPSPIIEEILSPIFRMTDRNEIISSLNQSLHEPETASQMEIHDWDEVVDEVNKYLSSLEQPDIDIPREFDYVKSELIDSPTMEERSKLLPPEYHNREYPDPNDMGRLSSGKFNLKQYKTATSDCKIDKSVLKKGSAIPVPEDGKPIEPEAKEIKDDDHHSRGNKFNFKKYKKAESPPGWGGTVEKMKGHPEIENPFGLTWSMKNKGDEPHYTEKGKKKEEFKDMPRGYPKKKR